MSRQILGLLNLGGAEILLILALLLIMGLGAAAVIFIVIVSSSRRDSRPAAPGTSSQPPDLEQQLRTLAKLKEDGIITAEDFNAKKKALLGL